MHRCHACHKDYSSEYNLKKHYQRQPLCKQWLSFDSGVKDFVDDKFMLPLTDAERKLAHRKCFICGTDFANVGNLNRHLDTSVICSKWSMYRDLAPLMAYAYPTSNPCRLRVNSINPAPCLECEVTTDAVATFTPLPSSGLVHIIWNIFLADKEFAREGLTEAMKDIDARFILAILPRGGPHDALLPAGVDNHVMEYEGHDEVLDAKEFDRQIEKIERHRRNRENVVVFCNNGYQRSVPFLCYYLMKHHGDEVSDAQRAVDIILSQVDKENFANVRVEIARRVGGLLAPYLPSLGGGGGGEGTEIQ